MVTPIRWPKLINRTLTDVPFHAPKDFCPQYCSRMLAKDAARDESQLPLCSRTQPATGVYLPERGRPLPSHSSRALRRPVNTGYVWRPSCRMDAQILSMKENILRQQCTTKRRNVLFIGDSHGRFLYDALMPRLAGKGEPSWVRFPLASRLCYNFSSNICSIVCSQRRCSRHASLGRSRWISCGIPLRTECSKASWTCHRTTRYLFREWFFAVIWFDSVKG
jgi:hypothetical protein